MFPLKPIISNPHLKPFVLKLDVSEEGMFSSEIREPWLLSGEFDQLWLSTSECIALSRVPLLQYTAELLTLPF